MKSRTSSCKLFHKAVFLKNLKRCWPIWACFGFLMMWFIPGVMYFSNTYSYAVDSVELKKKMAMMILEDFTRVAFWVSIFATIFIAMTIFSYLQNERSCNLIHSLPIKRDTMLATGIISGLTILFSVDLLIYGTTNFISLSNHVNIFGHMTEWLIITMLMQMFFYMLAIISMIVVGQTVASLFFYSFTITYFMIIPLIINTSSNMLFYGMSGDFFRIPDNWIKIISPGEFFGDIEIVSVYNDDSIAVDYVYENYGMHVIVAIIATAILVAVAVWLYRKRKSENSGDIIAIEFLRPVLKWIFAISASLFLTWFFIESVFSGNRYISLRYLVFSLMVVSFAIIAYIGAQMLIKKTFRVFKGIFVKLAIFTAVVIASTAILLATGNAAAKRVVPANEAQSMYISIGGKSLSIYDTTAMEEISEIHQAIIDDYDKMVTDLQTANYTNSISVSIIDYGINGDWENNQRRNYFIPNTMTTVYEKLREFTNNHAVEMLLPYYHEDYYVVREAHIYDYYNTSYKYKAYRLNAEDAEKVCQAIIEDLKEGNLTYAEASGSKNDHFLFDYGNEPEDINTVYIYGDEYTGDVMVDEKAIPAQSFNISIEYNAKIGNEISYYGTSDEITINENCINTIEVLNNCNWEELY